MAVYTKDTGSSSVLPGVGDQGCVGCPRVAQSESGTVPTLEAGEKTLALLLGQTLEETNSLKKDVARLEKEQEQAKKFYSASTKLSKTANIVLWVLLLIPLLQLVACTAVVYHLGIQEQLPGLLYWVLSGVSILSIVEMIALAIKISSIEKKLEEFDKRLSKLEEQ